jgi:hypothetical protein
MARSLRLLARYIQANPGENVSCLTFVARRHAGLAGRRRGGGLSEAKRRIRAGRHAALYIKSDRNVDTVVLQV